MRYIRLKGKFQNLSILSVYAPTEDAEENNKDNFYDKLTAYCNKISRHDMLITIGDYNAKIGKEYFVGEVAGQHSLHNISNNNGIRACSFAASQGMWISSVSFPHKNIHKETWKIPGMRGANQIDHVMIDKRHAISIADVRSYRGANCDSDHYLVVAKVHQRISNVSSRNSFKRTIWNTSKIIESTSERVRFQQKVEEKINRNQRENETNVSDKWNNIKSILSHAANETIGKKINNTNEWYDQECKQLNESKTQAKRKCLGAPTRQNLQDYQQKRKIAKKAIRKKKKQWMQHFRELLNSENENEFNNDNNNHDTILYRTVENVMELPTLNDIKKALNKLKNNKSGGEDSITAELLKYGSTKVYSELHSIVCQIWQEETIPQEWLTSIIIPIHKKGDKKICNNYRGISLLNTGYKVFTNVLYDKINLFAEEILGDYQCGFRQNRSTTDQCFILCQIFEKFFEYSIDIHCVFVDFKQAFDSINRSRIEQILQINGIPKKLIKLTMMTLTNTVAKVLIQGELSNSFEISSGVKQSDALSSLIFNLVLDSVVKDVDPGGTIFNKSVQICAYADDIVILSRNLNDLKETFEKLETTAITMGLNINTDKTNSDKDTSIEILQRIQSANKTYYAHRKLLHSKLLSRNQKLQMYKTLIRPVLTYGCEIWTLKSTDISALASFERKILRGIYGPIRSDDGSYRIRYNHEIENLIEKRNVIRFIKAERIGWLGHLLRMDDARVVKEVFKSVPEGYRRRGRPRKRWIEDVEADLRSMTVVNWNNLAKQKDQWRAVVAEAIVHPGL
ncbi:uncharacterized protein LOC129615538 [Condylostylus longicornis]|uniref:uncharacterized protein LOC129615538 n=1 Tax=Condylostylus longicornis TaxID=2530218 RepID=UPI00244DBA8F|nr:uncharacterized protein LOC129615538 [Condylostylus longicornis]